MTEEEKQILFSVLFNPIILRAIKPANYVRGTLGGAAETTRQFKAGLRREHELLNRVQKFIDGFSF